MARLVPVQLVGCDAAPLCEAGVALGDINLGLAWQAWRLVTSTFVPHGRRGTYGTGLAVMVRLVPVQLVGCDAAPLCEAGVALGDINLGLAWQPWRLVTSTFVPHGRRGTYGTGLAVMARLVPVQLASCDAAPLCEAGVALGDINLGLAWQAWRLVTSTFVPHGRRGTYGTGLALMVRLVPVQLVGCDAAPLCVAGVVFGDVHLRFPWQARRLVTSTCVAHGRRGTYGSGPALMALGPRWSATLCRLMQLCRKSFGFTFLHPSPLSFLPFLHSTSATISDYWKLLTCGVIRCYNSCIDSGLNCVRQIQWPTSWTRAVRHFCRPTRMWTINSW